MQAKRAKIGPENFFCHFLKFGLLVYLEIAYNDSLHQCLTSSGGKILVKKFWAPNLVQNQAKN